MCQISDFGMSRCLDDSYYYKSRGGLVPLKWTAPEVSNVLHEDGCLLRRHYDCDFRLLASRNTAQPVMSGVMAAYFMNCGR